MIASYHTVWFELHEDLLATLGIERGVGGRRADGHRPLRPGAHRDGHAVRRRRRPRPRRRGDAGPLAASTTATTASSSPAPPARRPTLTDDEKLELWTAVREAVDVPLVAGTGTNDTRHTCELGRARRRHRRRRPARRRAVLQPAVAGRARGALPGRRRGHRPAGRALRHPRPHRPQGRHRRCSSAWPTRCRRSSASRTPPATRARRPAWSPRRPTTSRSTPATTPMTLPLLAVGAVGVIGIATHWCGRGHGRDDRRVREGRPRPGAGAQRVAVRVVRGTRAASIAQFAHAVKVVLRVPRPAERAVPPADRPRARRARGRGQRRCSSASALLP